MESQEKHTKVERTTQEQLQHYIMFCKQHPELQRRKQTSTNRQGLQMLWSELADTLNALRGLTRTAAKWKESLMHWKHQLHSRARKIKAQEQVTCGDPLKIGMAEFEEQAIATFATAAVEGLPCAGALGQETCGGSPQVGMTEFEEQAIATSATTAVDELPPGTLGRQVLPLEEILRKIEAHERREEQAIALQQKIVEQNQQLTEVLRQMSQALTSITAVLNKLCDKLKKW